MKLHYGTEITP